MGSIPIISTKMSCGGGINRRFLVFLVEYRYNDKLQDLKEYKGKSTLMVQWWNWYTRST
jgi:hypothetical protein